MTSDPVIAKRLEEIRGDGRRYCRVAVEEGHPDLIADGGVQGYNFCLSEFQAALLLDALDRLEQETRTRADNADYLTALLRDVAGLTAIEPYPQNTLRAYYHYAVRFDPDEFGGCSVEAICAALEAELGQWVHPTYPPLDVHPLYRPAHAASLPAALRASIDGFRTSLPEAHLQSRRTILFHHSMLLGGGRHMEAIAGAFGKLRRNRAELARLLIQQRSG